MYMERSIASGPLEEQANQPGTPSAAPARNGADVMPLQEAAACGGINGSLPGTCAQMAFPYIPMQDMNPKRYDNREALQRGTLFPGLDLPFHMGVVDNASDENNENTRRKATVVPIKIEYV